MPTKKKGSTPIGVLRPGKEAEWAKENPEYGETETAPKRSNWLPKPPSEWKAPWGETRLGSVGSPNLDWKDVGTFMAPTVGLGAWGWNTTKDFVQDRVNEVRDADRSWQAHGEDVAAKQSQDTAPPAPVINPRTGKVQPQLRSTQPSQQRPTIPLPEWDAPESLQRALAGEWRDVPMPEPEKNARDMSLFDSKTVKGLLEHDYTVSEDDWGKLKKLYGREDAMGGPVVLKSGGIETAQMTDEAYNALSADQRKAVDFNTLLVEAREKDLKEGGKLEGAERDEYDKSVTELFGEGRGSDVIAPNTLRLLKSIQLDAKGQDLDQFLSLEAAVSAADLKDFKLQNPNAMPMVATGGDELQDFMKTNSAGTRAVTVGHAINQAGAYIEEAIKNPEFRTSDPMRAVKMSLGYQPTNVPFGWSTNPDVDRPNELDRKKEVFFQNTYNTLRNPKVTSLDGLWEVGKAYDFNESDWDELFKYIDERTRYEERTGAVEGGRSIKDIRKFAGLEG